ncbi:MAG: hypothetical protein EXQ84_07375 [Rhodospirillaceae bacterium]|nr:hypothetical protein [Rhodospirillaceae bacterium]
MATQGPSAESARSAYERERWSDSARTQRWLIITSGAVYSVGTLWVSLRVGADAAFATISLGALIGSALVYGLTYLRERRVRLYLIPGLFALIYASHIILGIAYATPGGAICAAFLLSLLGMALVALAPTLRAYVIAQGIAAVSALYGVVLFWPATNVPLWRANNGLLATRPDRDHGDCLAVGIRAVQNLPLIVVNVTAAGRCRQSGVTTGRRSVQWDPDIYLAFARYRAQPVEDLLPRINQMYRERSLTSAAAQEMSR